MNRYPLADCLARVGKAARRDDLRMHHLNPYEIDTVLFAHPDVQALDRVDKARGMRWGQRP